MTRSKELQLVSPAAAPQTPEHKRFYSLIRRVEKARQTLSEWQEQIQGFRQQYTAVLLPLHGSIDDAITEWLFALDAALQRGGWTRAEKLLLREILCKEAGELLAAKSDAAVKQLFDKYSHVSFDTGKQQELEMLKVAAQAFGNLDLGDDSTIRSEADLEQRIFEQMAAQQEAERARQAERARRRGKSAAQQRREHEARAVTQSIREIFRKLASALHPDREPDPERRATKTSLMQKVNQAYDTNDLLTLLEVQLQIEQVSGEQIHNAGSERLKHYNKLLDEQLRSLTLQIYRIQTDFQFEFNQDSRCKQPKGLVRLAQEEANLLRAELSAVKRDLRMLSDVAATKRWLKRERRERRDTEFADEPPF